MILGTKKRQRLGELSFSEKNNLLMGYSKKLIMYWGFTSIIIADAFFPYNDPFQQSSQFHEADFVHFYNTFVSAAVRFHYISWLSGFFRGIRGRSEQRLELFSGDLLFLHQKRR